MKNRQSSKENTSHLFSRYIWLVDTIYRCKEITFDEINRKWINSSINENGENMPVRTFHNHRIAIEEMFDINIECNKNGGYKYYIENADDIENGEVRNWLLSTLSVNNLIKDSYHLRSRILFENIPSGRIFLVPIIEAMRDCVNINITYQSYIKNEPHTFVVQPYCLKIFKQRWYLIAYNSFYDEIRTYALDRIKNLEVTSDQFKFPNNFNSNEYFDCRFGIIVDNEKKSEKVTLKAFGSKKLYIKDLPLHNSQEIIETNTEYTLFQYYLYPTYDFIQEILSHENYIEVMEPLWLRKQIYYTLKQMCERYEKE